jgi:hypothetical protein
LPPIHKSAFQYVGITDEKIKKYKRRVASCGMTFIRLMKIHHIVPKLLEHTHKHIYMYACTHEYEIK